MPRYGTEPVIVLDGDPADIAVPAIRQRRRLAHALASFDDEQWANPSRCEGWSTRDVIVHLDSTNTFWTFAIEAGLRGEPTSFLATFDPVTSPADLVAASADLSTAAVLERFAASTVAFTNLLGSLDDHAWCLLAEAPPGHVSVSALTHHALWDSWVHERDVLLPLGITPSEEADEVSACLRYGAGLGPAFALCRGESRTGVLVVDTTEPDVAAVVEIADRVTVRAGTADADLRLTGNSVRLLEALSVRRPFDLDVPADASWMLSGLVRTFSTEP
ncbi:MAG: maleylpyruvate isomerase family mycothiol-dependent enzyme [Ilumatobacteraceae bacterium]